MEMELQKRKIDKSGNGKKRRGTERTGYSFYWRLNGRPLQVPTYIARRVASLCPNPSSMYTCKVGQGDRKEGGGRNGTRSGSSSE